MPTINITDGTAIEGSGSNRGTATFSVTLSEASASDVTVVFRTRSDGSAVEGEDFFGGTGIVRFLPGETLKQISILHDSDLPDESDENYTVELSSPVNATLAGGEATLSATGIIQDSDGGTNNLALFVSDPIIAEGQSGTKQAIFEVQLSAPLGLAITLPFTTVDGTATAGEDYAATAGSLTFAAGQTLTTVAVDVFGDTDIEASETFSLVVTPNGFIQSGAQDSTGVAILMDEDSANGLPVLSVEGAAGREGSGSDRGTAVFKITLSEASTSDVTVLTRFFDDGVAINGTDYFGTSSLLTFRPGETVKFVSVLHQSDLPDESDENYTIALSDPQGAVLAGGQDLLTATGIVQDSDGSSNNLALFVSDPTVQETGDASVEAVFELLLSRPSTSDITLNYTTANGTATAGVDYTPTLGSVTFLAGQTFATVAVDVLGDEINEANETFSLIVTPNGFIQNGTQDSTGMGTISNFSGREIEGTSGNDRLIGSALNDTLFGGEGADYLDGGVGSDAMSGGLGNDFYIVDNVGDQTLGEIAFSLGGGIDTVRSFIDYVQPDNIELVRLGNIDDTDNLNATGNDAPGTLVGNAGDNNLTGRGGNDQLNGNNGDDTITGNTGRDTLVGGAGDDTFIYTAYADSRAGGDARDLINGFDRLLNANDTIDLRLLDADTSTFGVNDAFDFVGSARFSGQAGELRYQGLGGPNAVIVEADHNGDGVADLQIFVNLTTFMTGTDFLL